MRILILLIGALAICSCKKKINSPFLGKPVALSQAQLGLIEPQRLNVEDIDVSGYQVYNYEFNGNYYPSIFFPIAIFDAVEILACLGNPTCRPEDEDSYYGMYYTDNAVLPLKKGGTWFIKMRPCLTYERSIEGYSICKSTTVPLEITMSQTNDPAGADLIDLAVQYHATYHDIGTYLDIRLRETYGELAACPAPDSEAMDRLRLTIEAGISDKVGQIWNGKSLEESFKFGLAEDSNLGKLLEKKIKQTMAGISSRKENSSPQKKLAAQVSVAATQPAATQAVNVVDDFVRTIESIVNKKIIVEKIAEEKALNLLKMMLKSQYEQIWDMLDETQRNFILGKDIEGFKFTNETLPGRLEGIRKILASDTLALAPQAGSKAIADASTQSSAPPAQKVSVPRPSSKAGESNKAKGNLIEDLKRRQTEKAQKGAVLEVWKAMDSMIGDPLDSEALDKMREHLKQNAEFYSALEKLREIQLLDDPIIKKDMDDLIKEQRRAQLHIQLYDAIQSALETRQGDSAALLKEVRKVLDANQLLPQESRLKLSFDAPVTITDLDIKGEFENFIKELDEERKRYQGYMLSKVTYNPDRKSVRSPAEKFSLVLDEATKQIKILRDLTGDQNFAVEAEKSIEESRQKMASEMQKKFVFDDASQLVREDPTGKPLGEIFEERNRQIVDIISSWDDKVTKAVQATVSYRLTADDIVPILTGEKSAPNPELERIFREQNLLVTAEEYKQLTTLEEQRAKLADIIENQIGNPKEKITAIKNTLATKGKAIEVAQIKLRQAHDKLKPVEALFKSKTTSSKLELYAQLNNLREAGELLVAAEVDPRKLKMDERIKTKRVSLQNATHWSAFERLVETWRESAGSDADIGQLKAEMTISAQSVEKTLQSTNLNAEQSLRQKLRRWAENTAGHLGFSLSAPATSTAAPKTVLGRPAGGLLQDDLFDDLLKEIEEDEKELTAKDKKGPTHESARKALSESLQRLQIHPESAPKSIKPFLKPGVSKNSFSMGDLEDLLRVFARTTRLSGGSNSCTERALARAKADISDILSEENKIAETKELLRLLFDQN